MGLGLSSVATLLVDYLLVSQEATYLCCGRLPIASVPRSHVSPYFHIGLSSFHTDIKHSLFAGLCRLTTRDAQLRDTRTCLFRPLHFTSRINPESLSRKPGLREGSAKGLSWIHG